ncbi:Catalase [[Actinomadura] parvosata subsp. kistnae]|uniref:peroxidase family protein n=1 Tax=[Actinomadura] parvosata TaxID=1955412 RepID=UPI000D276E3C|nr:peroxidase family protein [Nonomuraea sp. ATCC 55076]SPL94806.1 Catalase [Actinomadura parvosata subsp. kistnae]
MSQARIGGLSAPEWHELPFPLQLAALARMRAALRRHNLYDTRPAGGERPRISGPRPRHRSYDGSGYDPGDADMGRAGTRFDRNAPLPMTHPEGLLSPNPRDVANRLLTRHDLIPATSLNMLAAAWIQFQNHDWFSHGDNRLTEPMRVPIPDGDHWYEPDMCVRRSRPDPTPHTEPDAPPTYENTVTHWWDGSQLYGSSERHCRALRTGEDGRMLLHDGRLPEETAPGLAGIDLTGFNDNYWVGLALLHTLFVKEHNAICGRLRAAYPSWDDERLFHTARLVNVAVMARIHTVEWTPAILGNRAVRLAMNANWAGLLGPGFRRRYGRVGRGEVVSGILGSPMNHHAAPYSMTEEFVASYRFHPLIRDDYPVRSHRDGSLITVEELLPIQGQHTRAAVDRHGMSDWLYSFGAMNPGALTLHNHPRSMRDLVRTSGERIDIGTLDLLRDRERGVPRYNDFRRMLRKRPVTDFARLSDDPGWAREIEEVYDGDPERVDVTVGLLAEPKPPGFAMSDTAFRVFVLMASRRLKSDPFFTDLFTPEVYSPEGLDWIDRTGMTEVLLRHHPELAPALDGLPHAFVPWRRPA